MADIWHCEGRIGFEALSIRVSHLAVWSSFSGVTLLGTDEGGSAVGVRTGGIRPRTHKSCSASSMPKHS